MNPQMRALGQAGEEYVAKALTDQNWQILQRNFRSIGCELDIIARKRRSLIFVEVKTTSRTIKTELIQNMLHRRKCRALRAGVSAYLNQNALTEVESIRIDLAVLQMRIINRQILACRYFPDVLPIVV